MKMERQVFFKGWASGIFASCDDDYACLAWCDHVQERVSYKGVQFKTFCQPVKPSCSPTKNVKNCETSEEGLITNYILFWVKFVYLLVIGFQGSSIWEGYREFETDILESLEVSANIQFSTFFFAMVAFFCFVC